MTDLLKLLLWNYFYELYEILLVSNNKFSQETTLLRKIVVKAKTLS